MVSGRAALACVALGQQLSPAIARKPYSVLNALIGEIDAARPAGMIAAKNAHTASAPAATPSAIGSQNETP